VWGDVNVDGNPERVVANWDQIKASERAEKGEVDKSLLDGVSLALPALMQAYEYDKRAARAGFDWQETTGVVAKVREELDEVLQAADDQERFSEIGDLLLSVVVLARWLKVAPEDALRVACKRFYNRFTWVENSIKETGRKIPDVGFEELNELWGRAKAATATITDHSAK
jgi:MazG family protein